MRMNKLAVLTSMALAVCLNVQAESYTTKSGTIAGVDLSKDTFSVQSNGETREYNFPQAVNVIIDGSVQHDKALIHPGHAVVLKFSQSTVESAMDNAHKSTQGLTVTGKILELDRTNRSGTLQQERTNKVIAFHFADDFNSPIPRVGDMVVFAYILDSVKVGMK